jgi:signal transduction histidine kinase
MPKSKKIDQVEDYPVTVDNNLDFSPELPQQAYLNLLEDMQDERKQSDDQRIATYNILEDIMEAQEALQNRLIQVQTLRETLEKLSISMNPKHIMETIVNSLTNLVPYYSLTFVIAQGEGSQFANSVYVTAKGPVGRTYITNIQRDFITFVDGMPKSVKNRSSIKNQLQRKMYPEIQKGYYDDDRGVLSTSSFVVPFTLRSADTKTSKILGLFHIASINPKDTLSQYQIEIIYDLANVAAMNMQRIMSIASTEQARLSSLLRSMSNGVLLFDSLRNVLLVNPACARMLGLSVENRLAQQQQQQQQQQVRFIEITRIFKDSSPSFLDKVNRVLKHGEEIHLENLMISQFTYEIFILPVRDSADVITGGAIIMHDITHLKEIDRMKTEFVSVASHQLRTPLTAIKLFSEMLLSGEIGKVDGKHKEYLENISQSTSRMVRLVNDLLNVSRLETGRLKIETRPRVIEDIIVSTIKEVDMLAKAQKCDLRFDHPKINYPKVPLDESLFRQVVHNLITNAIRYSPAKKCAIVITLGEKDNDYLISVADSGIGIPKLEQGRIFEKFFRADNAMKAETEGSGLGLYVVKMITNASGGKIWFETEEGKGTTFYVSIPKSGMHEQKGQKGLAS